MKRKTAAKTVTKGVMHATVPTNRCFSNASDAFEYTMAGHATITLSSKVTGARYTFRVTAPKHDYDDRIKPEDAKIRFVSVLSGTDNDTDYTYLGILQYRIEGLAFRLTTKSRMNGMNEESGPVKAFRYFFNNVLVAKKLPAQLEVRHEGHCGRCGRTLTVPESIDRGIGPECAGIIGNHSNVVSLTDRLHQHLHV